MAQPIRLSPTEAYERWAASYDDNPNALLTLEERCLRPLLTGVAGQLVLDVACGTGRRVAQLNNAGARACGTDLTRAMLARAVAKAGIPGRCAEADALRLPFGDSTADLVLSSFLAGYVESLPLLFAELARVARPGGRIVLSELHPNAARVGWRRSFRVAGKVYEPEWTAHSAESVPIAARNTGVLDLSEFGEYAFEESERAVFEQAGKTNFDEVKDQPAIWIGVWQRPLKR